MMRYALLWLIICFSSCELLNGLSIRRHRIISNPEAPPSRLIAKLSFRQLTGGVIILHGQINERLEDTLNFILDTGSGGISLDSSTCEQIKLPVQSSDRYLNGFRGKKRLFFSYDNTLHLSGLKVDNLNFYINDYSFLSMVYGLKIDGIIGFDFLKRYIVKIDYNRKKLFVYTPGRYVYSRRGILLHPKLQQIPLISVGIQSINAPIKSNFYFDIGAGLCLMLSEQFTKDSCLFCPPYQQKHQLVVTAMQSASGSLKMRKTVIDKVQIGPYAFQKVPVYLFDNLKGVISYPLVGGLIGNDLLKRFNATLNYSQQEIFLHPNTLKKSTFDYAYTGITLYWIKGEVVVGSVISPSPGEEAGLKEGDQIISIDHHFNKDLQTYRKLLKETGKTIPIVFQRKGEVKKTTLKIKSIL